MLASRVRRPPSKVLTKRDCGELSSVIFAVSGSEAVGMISEVEQAVSIRAVRVKPARGVAVLRKDKAGTGSF